MNKKFNELKEGAVFKYNGLDYKKVPQVKVSCCRSLNAQEVNNQQNQIFVQPLIEVEVVDELQ